MKRVLVILVFFFSTNSFCQSLEDLVLDAGNLFLKGDYAKAIPAAQKAAEAVKGAMGEDNLLYIGLLTIQASSHKFLFQFTQSEKIYLGLKNLIIKVHGAQDESYTAWLNNFAGLYEKMGQYHKAEPLFLEAMEIRKKIAGEYDDSYSSCLNGLATLYHTMGQYAKAEPLYSKVIEIRKKVFSEENVNYATSLNNLATLYMETGQYERAEQLFLKANDIQKRLLGENDANYALGLNNIANLWQQLKQYEKAEKAYLLSAEIRKNTLGPLHPDYAASLNNLATLYAEQNQYKKAGSYLAEAVEIWKKSAGESSVAYATGLNNLGAFYRKTQMEYAKAETYYKEALRLRKMILGANHPFRSETENDLALLYIHMNEYKKAEPLFLSSSAILLSNITSTFTILSEKEKANYLDYNKSLIESNNSFLYHYPQASTAILENNYNLELGFKSFSLADTRNMLEQVRNSQDTSLKRIFDNWITLKNFLSKQYALPAPNRASTLGASETEAETLEKELNRRSAAFSSQQKALRITMKEVQQQLDENEAAVEFVKFRLYTTRMSDTVMYGAYIVRKHDPAPRFILLCQERELKQVLDSAGGSPNRIVRTLYRGPEGAAKAIPLGIRLYNLIWAPLEPYLKGVQKIAYSTAGYLYGIAFHALTVDAKKILMDQYRLQQYTSTRQVALRNTANESGRPNQVVLFGDALFTMDSLQLVRQRKTADSVMLTSVVTRGNGMGMWSSLPGTAQEIKTIKTLFEENKISTATFMGEAASEENLKAQGGRSPQILHIATHGFFLPQMETPVSGYGNVYSLANDPLLRSGLVFAGGNYVWSGRPPIEGIEDGIATAYEISQLNLGNTELLVLSACETALGDIRGSEGVFGHQGFQ